jgi:hypothetical protein
MFLVLINLRTIGYHLAILTNWLSYIFQIKIKTKITKKYWFHFFNLKIMVICKVRKTQHMNLKFGHIWGEIKKNLQNKEKKH